MEESKRNINYNLINRFAEKYFVKFTDNEKTALTVIVIIKTIFQITILTSGFRWLSADDYCRTVKSFEWLQDPVIRSGVWLSMHFWFNGAVMIFVKDLIMAAGAVSFIFSLTSIFYFYKISVILFDKKTAFWSSVIFSLFPFQVWLSLSGLPESVYFFFVIAGIYYFLKWKAADKTIFLFLAAVSFALSNGFRYEAWLFSITFFGISAYSTVMGNKFSLKTIRILAIASVSGVTIIGWLILNYIDQKDAFYFAKETAKIYETLNTAGYIQKFVQYPVFLFFIAPITTFFALKITYTAIFKEKLTPLKYFVLFNVIELLLLMIQGVFGTGGTNMISRYVVINGILFIPLCVAQFFNFRKSIAVLTITATVFVSIIWSYYYPQPFREDTFEVGYTLRDQILKNNIEKKDKIYFEELEGFYDVFPVQAISNDPSRFILGNLPELATTEKKSKKKSNLSDEELNILDIKSYLEKNNITLAIVKSDSYSKKLSNICLRSEEIGDYKLYYFKDHKSNVNDSSIKIFAKNIVSLNNNPQILNFDKMLALNEVIIDNTSFGYNPQSVSLEWSSVTKDIVDSIDYENYGFDRYNAVIELRSALDDSIVHIETKKIFSDRNIEDLLENNKIRTIVIIKPFALLQYSIKVKSFPFESGLYDLVLKIYDEKYRRELTVFRGDSLYTRNLSLQEDTLKSKIDSLKKSSTQVTKSNETKDEHTGLKLKQTDSTENGYSLGYIIAFFPDTDIAKLMRESNSNLYKVMLRSGFQILFAQRYQGDYLLNFMFSYF